MASYDRCKKAEETIDRETECVKKFKKLVDEKFQEVCSIHYTCTCTCL